MITIVKHKKGDWWDGIVLTFPFPIAGYVFKADFKTRPLGTVLFLFSTANGTMVIDTNLNTLTFVGRIIDEAPFKYISDLEMTPPNGHVKTISNIEFEITQDITM